MEQSVEFNFIDKFKVIASLPAHIWDLFFLKKISQKIQ